MKMITEIPPEITTPDSVETRLGTLKFFDGFPGGPTVEKVLDNRRAAGAPVLRAANEAHEGLAARGVDDGRPVQLLDVHVDELLVARPKN
jgi:hypothetical protein